MPFCVSAFVPPRAQEGLQPPLPRSATGATPVRGLLPTQVWALHPPNLAAAGYPVPCLKKQPCFPRTEKCFLVLPSVPPCFLLAQDRGAEGNALPSARHAPDPLALHARPSYQLAWPGPRSPRNRHPRQPLGQAAHPAGARAIVIGGRAAEFRACDALAQVFPGSKERIDREGGRGWRKHGFFFGQG